METESMTTERDDTERNEGIQRFLDNTADYCVPTPDKQQMIPMYATDPVQFTWGKPGTGFGQLLFYIRDGELLCDNECMSKEFIKERLCKMVDDCKTTEEW